MKRSIRKKKLSFFKRLTLFFKKPENLKRTIIIVAVGTVLTWLYWGIPLPTNLSSKEMPVSSKIFDRSGKLIYEIYTDQRRTPIKLGGLPAYVKEATISIEDKDFYRNKGFSITGIARALYNIVFKGNLQGGSTITQQLVKNSLLTPERTIKRKVREITLTFFVEAIYTKDQILELYLNQTPYGSSAYGIEAASELYLGKPAKDLTLAEAALLAGLPQSPTRYSPFGAHPEYAKERQLTVLKTMVENKYLTQDESDRAATSEIKYAIVKPPVAPHFALWVKEQLVDKYGEAMVDKGGLRITTTLDLDLQEFAQNAVATEVGKLKNQKVGNGAAIVTRPKSGEILAMVGSKDYFATDEDGKVNVVFAKRQPGSSIKPLNYALAFKDKKITPATALADVPTCFLVSGQEPYCPTDYDEKFHGLIQARFALGNSYNIPAVRVLALNGLENFVDFAKQMGLTTLTEASNYGLSLTLGGGEVRPSDMAVAFGVFANSGIKIPLVSILKVEDWKGKVYKNEVLASSAYEETNPEKIEGDRILPAEVTFLISHILYDNNARSAAFGESSYLNVSGHPEVSVKTGTTNDRRDNWTVGYTSQIVAVTWVGNNNNKTMSGAVSGISGASPIWNRIIKEALDKAEKGYYNHEDKGHAWPPQPQDIIGQSICATDGLLPPGPTDNQGCQTRFEYFLDGTVPQTVSGARQDIAINKLTGQMAGSDTPAATTETQNHPVATDPLGTVYCLDCPIASSSATIKYPSP